MSAYTVLGLSEGAPKETVKTKFRELAMKYHPDHNPGCAASEAKFKQISRAYDDITKGNTGNSTQNTTVNKKVHTHGLTLEQVYQGVSFNCYTTEGINLGFIHFTRGMVQGKIYDVKQLGKTIQVSINYLPHTFYTVENGHDLRAKVKVSYKDAKKNKLISIPSLKTGGVQFIELTPRVTTGQYSCPDRGMPIFGTNKFGNLILDVTVLPKPKLFGIFKV